MSDNKTVTREYIEGEFHICRDTVHDWIKNKKDFPKPFKIGRRLLWYKSEVDAYLKSKKESQ